NGRIDVIVQDEQSEEGLESTVLDCTSFPYKIARTGSITAAMITEILPNSIAHADYNDTEQPSSPGMKYKHYSPNTPLTIITDI
ncbi:Sua5 family C-terminal domain-containing protein, partial [Staphylococcus aureus]|nr:Sua5 family C-terminal domain-containing protein [Staphylococcus aureus]